MLMSGLASRPSYSDITDFDWSQILESDLIANKQWDDGIMMIDKTYSKPTCCINIPLTCTEATNIKWVSSFSIPSYGQYDYYICLFDENQNLLSKGRVFYGQGTVDKTFWISSTSKFCVFEVRNNATWELNKNIMLQLFRSSTFTYI